MRPPRLACLIACVLVALAAASATPVVAHGATRLGARELRLGAHGSGGRRLQLLLRSQGYRLSADGWFGPGTLAAVKRLQRAHHLVMDGVVGRATLAAL